MPYERHFTVGERIRYYRERRLLSQRNLAELVGRSENWIYKVEHGLLPVDRISVLWDLAQVLGVRDLSDLTGGVLSGAVDGSDAQHAAVPAIRRALSMPSSLLANGMGSETSEKFADAVAKAWEVYETQRENRYSDVGELLPGLLGWGNALLRDVDATSERPVIQDMISLYGLFQIWLRRLGEPALARIAADRGLALADSVGDPGLLAAAAWNLSCVLTSAGDVRDSVELAREMIANCAPDEDARVEHLSAYGALHLQGAVAAVRTSQDTVAWDLYRGAERVAERIGTDRNDWHTCFGPGNVAMHSVHLAAEEGNSSEAMRLADSIPLSDKTPLERRTRYLIEVMNCSRAQRDDYATVHMLGRLKAESPEEIVYSPLVREAVADLLKREKPLFKMELRAVARHIGMSA
ncbi:helix-turn-helix domain-containing protein [Streptomyces sp. F63]|uniref:helix-turn-helix domain-containing protein n=1 Tax=Streptomyces sp. F63 TaxID=2824887 RepID=UPI001B38B7F6|nr:helix-turn-helix transcriptional regulator [Streptomyces sp. F63]MBQ0983509.1 helix-turn-helix domain-containing protein [Streptomyces sp. F63]